MTQAASDQLIDGIRQSTITEVLSAERQADGYVTVEVKVDQHTFTISLGADTRIVKGNPAVLHEEKPNLRGRYNRIKNSDSFTVDELRQKNLPLYWNEDWLREELDRLGTYVAIAKEHGYPSSTTIASYAKRKFGISVQGKYEQKRKKIISEYKDGNVTHLDLANKHNVAVATVYRWLADADKPKVGKGRSSKKKPAATAARS